MLHTIYAWQSDPLNRIIDPFLSKHRYALRKLLDYIFLQFFYGNFPLYGKRVFEEHNPGTPPCFTPSTHGNPTR